MPYSAETPPGSLSWNNESYRKSDDDEIPTKTEEGSTMTLKISLEEARERALELMHQGYH